MFVGPIMGGVFARRYLDENRLVRGTAWDGVGRRKADVLKREFLKYLGEIKRLFLR